MSEPGSPPPRATLKSYPIRIRELTVLGVEQLTPKMARLRLGGSAIDGFESHVADEHVKLLFPDASGELRVPVQDGDHLDWPSPMPTSREYTIRKYDRDAAEIWIDAVLHEGGLASDWLGGLRGGESVWVAGPPRGWVVPEDFDFIVMLGDETALPAMARWLEELPRHARGIAGIEVADDAERQPIDAPDGVTVTWLVRNGVAAGTTTLLSDFAATVRIPPGAHPYVWASGEAGCIKPIRRWAKNLGLGKEQTNITGYWRRGRLGDILPGGRIPGPARRIASWAAGRR